MHTNVKPLRSGIHSSGRLTIERRRRKGALRAQARSDARLHAPRGLGQTSVYMTALHPDRGRSLKKDESYEWYIGMPTRVMAEAPTHTPHDCTRACAQCTVGVVEKGSLRSDHVGLVGNIARNIDFNILTGVYCHQMVELASTRTPHDCTRAPQYAEHTHGCNRVACV